MSREYNSAHAALDAPFSIELFTNSKGVWIAAGIAFLYLIVNLLSRSDLSHLPPAEYFWNAIVFITPTSLVLALDKRKNPSMYATGPPETPFASERHAVKSEAMRRLFGLDSGALFRTLSGASSMRRASWLSSRTTLSDAPPGLGNWDNSCYQNSVLQGLSALRSLTAFLVHSDAIKRQGSTSTAGSLCELMDKLNDSSNNGRRIWTPAKLKSMSSWQQQDAQEYFSKIMDDLEKETIQAVRTERIGGGLEGTKSLEENQEIGEDDGIGKSRTCTELGTPESQTNRNPLDGFLAQRVACMRCGFSEGLSMIPFNCLTVPLGTRSSYSIQDCLNEYTSLEEITGVECAKCTLLNQKSQLEQKLNGPSESANIDTPSPFSLPPEPRTMFVDRLQHVQQALDDDDLSDNTLSKKCQVPKSARISSTKTRQAVIAKAPQSLAIHVNRSSFDIYTGDQRKNLAEVRYPKILDLQPWCLGTTSKGDASREEWSMDPATSMISPAAPGDGTTPTQYVLRAAVCHYGRHENGHYICYRTHPERTPDNADYSAEPAKQKPAKWWRLSDDDVSPVTEEHVLGQGGVFMLFYERLNMPPPERSSMPAEESLREEAAASQKDPPTSIAGDIGEELPTEDSPSNKPDEDAPSPTSEELATNNPIPDISAAEPETEQTDEKTLSPEIKTMPTPPAMRTSRKGKGSKRAKDGFSSAFRAVAAT